MQVFTLLSLRVVMLRTALVALLPLVSSMCFAETQAVDIYSQDQLLEMIRGEKYLARVKQDDCQLVQDSPCISFCGEKCSTTEPV